MREKSPTSPVTLEGQQADTVELAFEDPFRTGEALCVSVAAIGTIQSGKFVMRCRSSIAAYAEGAASAGLRHEPPRVPEPEAGTPPFVESQSRVVERETRRSSATSDVLVSHYRVLERLGEGRMGEVYVGLDETLKRRVAMKAIRVEHRLDSVSKARFRVRHASCRGSTTRNICRVYDFSEGDDRDWLVMELIEGKSLQVALRDRLDLAVKLKIAEQVAAVLATHAAGVAASTQPGNVMLTRGSQVKVLDFGPRMSSVSKVRLNVNRRDTSEARRWTRTSDDYTVLEVWALALLQLRRSEEALPALRKLQGMGTGIWYFSHLSGLTGAALAATLTTSRVDPCTPQSLNRPATCRRLSSTGALPLTASFAVRLFNAALTLFWLATLVTGRSTAFFQSTG